MVGDWDGTGKGLSSWTGLPVRMLMNRVGYKNRRNANSKQYKYNKPAFKGGLLKKGHVSRLLSPLIINLLHTSKDTHRVLPERLPGALLPILS